jgi:tight adherence protein C
MVDLIVVAFIGVLVIVTFSAMAYAGYVFLTPSRTASDRLRELSNVEDVETFDIIGVGDTKDAGGVTSKLGQLAEPTSEEEKNRQRQMLLQAGYKHRRALEIFNSVRVTLAICLPMVFAPIAAGWGILQMAGVALVATAAGYYAPQFWLVNVTEKRKQELLKSFPDALDLLVSCVEAGLGLDAAFRRVAGEIETAAPDLAREFQIVTHEVSAGVSRVDALRHLEMRTGLDEVRSLVNMLAQAERFGTSIANGLRVHARITRQKRMSRAEEEAAKVSPKLTVVMILFLLPVLGAVLMGPAIIKVIDVMSNQ